MKIIVQKFGGTSVATPEVRELVVKKVLKAKQQGFAPVLVVSAMGRKGAPYATDTIIGVARASNEHIAPHELDLMMCCGEMISAVVMTGRLQREKLDAVMMTGGQAGIITDDNYGNARILKVDTNRIMAALKAGRIPVVCGFQGITSGGQLTTLGRGGSDTTASALGAALNADMVEIYTDVDGIMTADPRIVDNARILDSISYSEVCQLAHQGAKVIHPRAVEIAMQRNIPLVVKSTFSDAPGTMITNLASENPNDERSVPDRIATGVTYLCNIAQIRVNLDGQAEEKKGSQVFRAMAENDISVDLINVHPGQIMFTVSEELAEKAAEKLAALGYETAILHDCAKVSVVGGGMREVPGVMASFVEALAVHEIPILQTVDSNASISVLVKKEHLKLATESLHEKFGLAQ